MLSCFDFVEKTKFRPKFRSVASTFDFVKATFDFVERIVRLVAFDNFASTLLLMWTGLESTSLRVTHASARDESTEGNNLSTKTVNKARRRTLDIYKHVHVYCRRTYELNKYRECKLQTAKGYNDRSFPRLINCT